MLPVVDGVDELDAGETPGRESRAAALLERVNAYQDTMQRAPVVLTCRWRQYRALTAADASARTAVVLRLDHVDALQASTYLEHRVADGELGQARWEPVLECLHPSPSAPLSPLSATAGPALRAAMSTPWRLTLAATVFQQPAPAGGGAPHLRNPARLLDRALDGTIHHYLLGGYIPATVAGLPPGDRSYGPLAARLVPSPPLRGPRTEHR